jgi:hypothetical protein
MSTTLFIAALTIATVSGFALGLVYSHIRDLTRRIKALEQAQVKHLPYRTAEEIEDATAAILKLKFEADFRQSLVENALSHLQMAREDKRG